jgi:hypothetical protein
MLARHWIINIPLHVKKNFVQKTEIPMAIFTYISKVPDLRSEFHQGDVFMVIFTSSRRNDQMNKPAL